jgi:hypothetical protein
MDLKDIAVLTDAFGQKRAERLEADKKANALKEEENMLKERIISALLEAGSATVAGSKFGVNLQTKKKPVAQDWELIHKYILENEALDLLHRRLTEEAVKVRWEDGLQIPGVSSYTVYDLTVSKR